ncbi:MAG: hypothetical protein Q8M95_08375 [Candidatus Methanoperedens sp.]|nr:hypothetical protein [Candidatus Methanoperedens sp.]
MSGIQEIDDETLQQIYSTFKRETKAYGWKYIFFNSMDEFEKSTKFISVNGKAFMDGTKTTDKEHARKNLYQTPTGQFVLISDTAWKDMGVDKSQIANHLKKKD